MWLQCNPYLLPILALKSQLPLKLQNMVEMEFKHRLHQLLRFWPRSRLLKLLSQPWAGDITFVLPATAFPLLKSAVNFTPDDIIQAMREGQMAVWGKLPALRASCASEYAIDECLKRLTREASANRKQVGAWVQLHGRGGGERGDGGVAGAALCSRCTAMVHCTADVLPCCLALNAMTHLACSPLRNGSS